MSELSGQIVYLVEMRTWINGVMLCTPSYLGTSWEDVQEFVNDPLNSEGEEATWWWAAPAVIGDRCAATYMKTREARIYDLKGVRCEEQPSVSESLADRFDNH